MLEKDLESRFRRFVQSAQGKCYKWVSPGETGVPDRICIFPGGHIVFVELKRPGRKNGQSPRQKKVQQILQALGCRCWLIDDLEDFKRRLREEGIIEI